MQKNIKESEIEIQRKGWKVNSFTLYLVESHIPQGRIARYMDVNRATVQAWLKMDKLSSTVDFMFRVARKMRLMGLDLFSYM